MSGILIKNIGKIVQVRDLPVEKLSGTEMLKLPCLSEAWLHIEGGIIKDFGGMHTCPDFSLQRDLRVLDVVGGYVYPSWVDSHTHLVYAGTREIEFYDRIRGMTYTEIAERGGGILNSAKRLSEASEEELLREALPRLHEIALQGTGTVEIKSGYGLTLESELKILRVIKKLAAISLLHIKATFLGAHAIPSEFKGSREKYIRQIIEEMIPRVAEERLAEFIDVFCEKGYFSQKETEEILLAGKKYGLKGKVHAEQLSHSGGIAAGVHCEAISVDHLEFINREDMELLKGGRTMPVILPGAAFFLDLPRPPAREIIDFGLPLAIASDFNPGSSPSGNMNFMQSVACIQYGVHPEEAINACTINGAYSLGLSGEVGSIERGKKANLFITRAIPSYIFPIYSFASSCIETVILAGKIYSEKDGREKVQVV